MKFKAIIPFSYLDENDNIRDSYIGEIVEGRNEREIRRNFPSYRSNDVKIQRHYCNDWIDDLFD